MNSQNYNQLQRNGLKIVEQQKPEVFDSMVYNKPLYNIPNQRYEPQNPYKDFGSLSQRVTPDQPIRQLKPQTIYTSANQQFIQAPHFENIEAQRKQMDLKKYDRQREFLEQADRQQDKIQTMVLRSQLAQKTPEQILNEFKAYTLPKLRLKRLIKLQAAMKGYHVRRFLIPRKKQNLRACEVFCENFLRRTLYDKFVPDIVMEVIAHNKHNQDLSLYSDKHQAFLRVIDDLLNKVVRRMANEVVKDQTDYLVTSILNQRFKDKPEGEKDPMKLVAIQLIQQFMDKEVYIIAKETIKESSQDYYQDLQYVRVMKEYIIPNTVRSIILDALNDLAIEKYLDDLCNEMVRQLAQPLSSQIVQYLQAEQESQSLDQALQNYIFRMIGDVMIEHLLFVDSQEIATNPIQE